MNLQRTNIKKGNFWVSQGIKAFFRKPFSFILLFITFTLVIAALSIIPFIGGIASLIFVPSAYLGFMVASKEVAAGNMFSPLTLFSGFKDTSEKRRNLITLGLLYLGTLIIIMLCTSLIDGGTFAKMYLLGRQPSDVVLKSASFIHAALLAMILYIPLSMLFWHAPALIYWENISAQKAMFFSFIAIKHNFLTFALFSVTWLSISFLILFLISVIAGVLASKLFLIVIFTIATACLASMFLASIYFSYRDCFDSSD
jgi:hypothetical protein